MWFVTVFGPPGASAPEHSPRGMGSRLHSAPNLSDLHSCRQKITKQHSDPLVAHFGHTPVSQPLQIHGLQHCRQLRSSPKLSEFMQRSPLPTIMGSPTKVNQGVCFWVFHGLSCCVFSGWTTVWSLTWIYHHLFTVLQGLLNNLCEIWWCSNSSHLAAVFAVWVESRVLNRQWKGADQIRTEAH